MPENQEPADWSPEAVEKQAEQTPETPPETPETPPETPEGEQPAQRKAVEKFVPLQALQAERATLKEMRQQFRQSQEQAAQLQRMNVELMQRMQQPQTFTPPPDEATDPVGALQHTTKETAAQLRYMAEQQAQRDQQQQHAQQRQAFMQHVATLENQFAQQQPDVVDAIKHLQQSMYAEYTAGGLSPEAARHRINQESLGLAWEAVQRGDNPAEVAFNRAKARGYTPGAKKLEMQREGQGASMPTGAGGKSGGMPSLESLSKMSSADFLKATEGGRWAQLVKR